MRAVHSESRSLLLRVVVCEQRKSRLLQFGVMGKHQMFSVQSATAVTIGHLEIAIKPRKKLLQDRPEGEVILQLFFDSSGIFPMELIQKD
jgi:hypothetical protein